MNQNILHLLFLNNPEIPFAVSEFCQSLPAYNQARQEYFQMAQEIQKLLGFDRYSAYEACLNRYWSTENWVYYLFGLHLRREVLEGFRPKI